MADARDRVAQRASLRPLLAPRSVAVVGRRPLARRDRARDAAVPASSTASAGACTRSTRTPARSPACPSYPSLSAVPDPVDLVVIAVPAAGVPAVIADAGVGRRAGGRDPHRRLRRGRRGRRPDPGRDGAAGPAARHPPGRAELPRRAQHRPGRTAGRHFSPVLPPVGGLALASQSGAVGIAVLDHAARTGAGVSSFVSLGNKADVSGNDLLSYWFDDPATTAVALYLESFGNPRRFARIARALARRKPVLAVVSGRSVAGQRAGASHTAAAASPDIAVDTLCAQAGIVRVDHLGELLDAARMMTDQPLPAGDRIAVIGNAGRRQRARRRCGRAGRAAGARAQRRPAGPARRRRGQPARPRCGCHVGCLRAQPRGSSRTAVRSTRWS